MFRTLTEILSETHYCVRPGVFEILRQQILSNIDTHTASGVAAEEHLQAFAIFKNGELVKSPKSVLDFNTAEDSMEVKADLMQCESKEGEADAASEDARDSKSFINVLRLTGPMTRGGGDCSYGSKDHRDMMMEQADDPDCIAHIIYASTPGGAASTIRDYRKAINYCHSKGQKVYLFCDGDVASGGAFLGCLCDEIWANNAEDEIGSLGMYAAFFTLKDGAEDHISSEVYHEFYADASVDKNGIYRAARDGDTEKVMADLNASLAQMLADARKDRPSIREDQLTGKMYKMSEVVGSLVDEIGSFDALCHHAYSERKQRGDAPLPVKEQAEVTPASNSNKENMKTYSNIAALVGDEAYESQVDGFLSLNEEMADRLETRAGEIAEELKGVKEVKEQLSASQKKLDETQAELENTQKELEAAKADETSELLEKEKAHSAELQEKNDQLTTELTEIKEAQTQAAEEMENKLKEIEDLKAQLSAKDAEITAQTQKVEDLNQTLEGINGNAAQAPKQEGAKSNGAEVQTPKMKVNAYSYDTNLSPAENAAKKEEYQRSLRAMANQG